MHRLDPVQIGARQLGEHLQAKIGDEAMAEIGDGDVGDIFGDTALTTVTITMAAVIQ